MSTVPCDNHHMSNRQGDQLKHKHLHLGRTDSLEETPQKVTKTKIAWPQAQLCPGQVSDFAFLWHCPPDSDIAIP